MGCARRGRSGVAVATAYDDVVNATLQVLDVNWIEVVVIKGLGIQRFAGGPVTQDEFINGSGRLGVGYARIAVDFAGAQTKLAGSAEARACCVYTRMR